MKAQADMPVRINLSWCQFLIVFSLFLLSCGDAHQRQIKKAIGGRIEGKDTLISIVKEYSKEGWLLSEFQPELYCSDDYKYDQQGRVTESEHVCGESSSNGSTIYEYLPNKTCSREYASVYTRIICDSFNTEGILIKKRYERNSGMIFRLSLKRV